MHEALKGLANGLYIGSIITLGVSVILLLTKFDLGMIAVKIAIGEMLLSMSLAAIAILNKK